MLSRLTIKGFKSLAEVKDLELGQVNVFIGANGSGKSALLEAVGVLGAAAEGRLDEGALKSRGVRPSAADLFKTSLEHFEHIGPIAFDATWLDGNEPGRYAVELTYRSVVTPTSSDTDWRYQSERLDLGAVAILDRPSQSNSVHDVTIPGVPNLKVRNSAGSVVHVSGLPVFSGAAQGLIEGLRRYAIYAPVTPVLRGVLSDSEGQQDPVGLYGGRLAEALEELLDPIQQQLGTMDYADVFELLDWVSGIDVAEPSRDLLAASVPAPRQIIRFRDRWMRIERNQISGYDASEGALYVLFMLVLAMHPRTPPLLAIDNFDQAMHPRLARAMTRVFCHQVLEAKPSRQVMLTTHNPLVLDGLDLRDQRIRLFAVERNNAGATVIYPVNVSAAILDESPSALSLSTLWVMGRLGAVPDLF